MNKSALLKFLIGIGMNFFKAVLRPRCKYNFI